MRWPFRLASLVLGLAMIAAVVSALRPRTVDVEVAKVVRAPLEQQIVENGKTRVRERYTVSAPVAGTVARIALREGDVVEPGSVVARFLPPPSLLLDPRSRQVAEHQLASALEAYRQAQANARRAEAAHEQAQLALRRVNALAAQGVASPAQRDQATADARMRESELASARFAEKIAEQEIQQARAALRPSNPGSRAPEQLEVRSPIHGQVLRILHKSEGVVTSGTPLIELGNPQALELVVDVLSQDAAQIRPGMPARVLHWGGEPALSAKVRRVEPAAFTRISALGVDEQRVNVILDPDGPPEQWRALGDGFAVDIAITTWSNPDVLQVPTSALFRQGSGWAVFAVKSGRAVVREVEPGHRGELRAEILRGLQPDEIVVIHPGPSVRGGVAVSYR
jgi:HlyD family secretion protein